MATKKAPLLVYDYTKTEEYKMHVEALKMFEQMTPEEKRQTFIRAGIVSKNGGLVKRFGGTAPNPEDEEDNKDDED